MIAIKSVGKLVRNHVVDQVRSGPYEINIESDIAVGGVTAPSLSHPTNNQMGAVKTLPFERRKHRTQTVGKERAGFDRIERSQEPPAVCNTIWFASADDKASTVYPHKRIG